MLIISPSFRWQHVSLWFKAVNVGLQNDSGGLVTLFQFRQTDPSLKYLSLCLDRFDTGDKPWTNVYPLSLIKGDIKWLNGVFLLVL